MANRQSQKPQMILDYNANKGGADRFEQNLEKFSSWPKIVH